MFLRRLLPVAKPCRIVEAAKAEEATIKRLREQRERALARRRERAGEVAPEPSVLWPWPK